MVAKACLSPALQGAEVVVLSIRGVQVMVFLRPRVRGSTASDAEVGTAVVALLPMLQAMQHDRRVVRRDVLVEGVVVSATVVFFGRAANPSLASVDVEAVPVTRWPTQ